MILEKGALLNNRYRIVEILGQGGMGSVYRAIDENLGVEVAVKDNLFTTEEYARQFRREAVILASLRHSNLPRVTDHFVIEGHGQYLVMDYIEGEDLRQRMDRVGVISEDEAIIIGAAICDALTYLDTRTPPIVHRDIKPGNVKITPQGQIFLVDFGLAKVLQPGTHATTTGARAMTPGYSPPEQYGTARTDHRSDIFSLGATLYAALTGAIPEDALARAMDQAELTSVRKHNPRVSKKLANVIEKSLAVRPDDRFQNAEEYKQALLGARPGPRRKTGEYYVTPPPSGEERSVIPADEMELTPIPPIAGAIPRAENRSPLPMPLSTPLGNVENIDLTPSRPLPSKRGGGRGCLWVLLVVGLIFVAVALGAYAYDPGLANYALALVRPGTPSSTALGVPAASSTPTTALSIAPTTTSLPVVLPSTATETPTATETLVPTETPTPTMSPTPVPTAVGGGIGQLAFVSDRSGNNQIYITDIDGEQEPFQVTDVFEGACQPSFSPDGMKLVFTSPCEGNLGTYQGSGLFVINVDGTGLMPLLNVSGGDYDPAWSPDGTRIAFTSLRDSGRAQIYVYQFEDKSLVKLSDKYAYNMQPAWSPDGSKLAYVETTSGKDIIWIMDADGSNKERFSRSQAPILSTPNWSPDGQLMLFTQYLVSGGIPSLVAAPIPWESGVKEFRLSPNSVPMKEGRYSPDGFWIAFEGWPDGPNHDIYIIAANGAGRHQVTNDPRIDFDPAWRPMPPEAVPTP